jgi:hypothetical protein
LLSLFAASAAFVVLVQRDTFVRRWFVPPPPTAHAKLGQVLPRVEIASQTLPQAVAELSRLAGVAIHLDPDVVTREPGVVDQGDAAPQPSNGNSTTPQYQLRLKGVTLQAALDLLLSQYSLGTIPFTIVIGDQIQIVPADVALNSMSTRVYDVSHLLPPPGPKKPIPTQGPSNLCFPSQTTPPPQSDRERAAEAIPRLVDRLLPYPLIPVQTQRGSGFLFPDCASYMLGSRLVVTTTADGHATIRHVLQGLRTPVGRRL